MEPAVKNIEAEQKVKVKKKLKIRVSLGFKVTALIIVLIVLVATVTNYIIYSLGYEALKAEIQDKLKIVAANAALTVDTDKLKTVKEAKDEEGETYLELQKRLQEVQKASDNKLKYVYTFAKNPAAKDSYVYMLDAEPNDSEDHSTVGDIFPIDEFPTAIKGFEHSVVEPEPIEDEQFNTFSQTGYAPIRDKAGKVIGVIGVDMDVSVLKVEEAQMKRAGIIALLSSFILALILGILFSRYLTEPIRTLTKGTKRVAEGDLDTVVIVNRNDELGLLANSFNSMTKDLKASHETLRRYNLELEDMVAERTTELTHANKEIKDILDNMSQAIFTIDSDFKFNAQHSKFAFDIFGNITFSDRSLLDIFFQYNEQQKDRSNLEAWLQKVFGVTETSWENFEALQPVREIKINARNKKGQDVVKYIEVGFQPITDLNSQDKLSKLMVIVEDITVKKALELQIEKKQKEYKDNIDQIVEIINMDQELFEDFIQECKEHIASFEPKLIELKDDKENTELVNELFRIMHTLKGNARIFNLERIAGEAHAIENIFSAIRKGQVVMTDEILDETFKSLDNFNILFNETFEIYNKIVRGKDSGAGKTTGEENQKTENEVIKVKVYDLDKLARLISDVDRFVSEDLSEFANKGKMEVVEKLLKESEILLKDLRKIAIGKLFTRFPRMVRELSMELGKKVKFKTKGDGIEIDRNIFDKIADPMIHLVRNSLDHGLEKPEDRVALGKPEEGTLEVNVCSSNKELSIEISDDGKGLDVDKIKAKAVKNGLITADKALAMLDKEAVKLIFAPGFSTSDKVSDISGRGVGMDVVKTFVEEKLNGRVFLESKKDKGLKVILKVPVEV